MAVAGALQIETDLLPRIATGFCGGLSRTGGMCGAVSGGVMGISLAKGRSTPAESSEGAYQAVQRFLHAFEARFGTLNCSELVGVDTRTEEGRALAKQKGLYERCKVFASQAAVMALEEI